MYIEEENINKNKIAAVGSHNLQTASRLQQQWQDKEYRNFPVAVINYVTADTSISGEAARCWFGLFSMAYFDEEWCVQISKEKLAFTIKKSETSVRRYLAELEKAGYIYTESEKIRHGGNAANKIYVRVPERLDQILEEQPSRKKASIKKCGTITTPLGKASSTDLVGAGDPVRSSSRGAVRSDSRGGSRSDTPLYNTNHNKLYNNNNRDISRSSKENKKSVVVSHEGLTSEFPASSSQPIAKSLSTELSEIETQSGSTWGKGERACDSNGSLPNRHDDIEINLFEDEVSGEEIVDPQRQASEKDKIQQDIVNYQQDLDKLPSLETIQDSSKKYMVLKRSGELQASIEKCQDKLEELGKPAIKRDSSLKLKNGERELLPDDCKKINKAVVQKLLSNEIGFDEAKETVRSMSHEILWGYFAREQVPIGKSINICLKKHRASEWSNNPKHPSGVSMQQQARPQPKWWKATVCNASQAVSFDKGVSRVN